MDIFLLVALVIAFFILFSICGWCCKRKHQGVVFGQGGTAITVSNQPVNASPVVIPPYPLHAQHPVPQHVPMYPPAPGFQPTGMPSMPSYQTGHIPGDPLPPSMPYPPHIAPYPPQTAPPPSYNEAVLYPPQVVNEGYSKQSPYNPNY